MKKIRQIIQQLNPFGEHLEPEKPAVSVHAEQPPLMEPVKVGETVEAMIHEEYLSQQTEVNSGNVEDTEAIDNNAIEALKLEQNISFSLQQEESIIAPEQDAPGKESKYSAANFSPETENLEPVQIEEEATAPSEEEIESEISTTEEPIQEPSLSENRPFVKLAEECAGLMNEFDGYSQRLETDEGKMMVELLVKRMQELLERAGLERIDKVNEPFSILKHNPEPMMPVAEGETLKEIITPGLAIENRVFRKAKVLI